MEQHRQDASQRLSFKSIDLTKSYDEVAKSLEEVEEQNGPIYMLVNCAGMAICGVFEEITPEDAQFLMDVNYKTAYNCTRYVLPKMKHARDGIIVITGSQASLLGIYGYGPYAAAKFALRGMAETIAMEASHLGVSVTLALPADTDTPGFENEEKTKPEETKIISGSGGLHKPEEVAKKIVSDALVSWVLSVHVEIRRRQASVILSKASSLPFQGKLHCHLENGRSLLHHGNYINSKMRLNLKIQYRFLLF